jgi:hypothetical protein
MSKLHGLKRSQRKGITVYSPPAVVTDPAGSTLALGDYTWWGHPQAGKVLNGRIWKDNPLSFINHINEFFIEEG